MNENKKQIMSLKEFANTYADFYKNDIQMILAWSVYNGNQAELIASIADLAALMHTEFMKDKRKTWEWTYYAFMNLVHIDENSNTTECLNAMRMAYMAYQGNPKAFVKAADDIMSNPNITWEGVETLHPELKELYELGKNEG